MISKHIISIPKNEKLHKRLQDNKINKFTTTLHVLTLPQDQFTQFPNQIHNIQKSTIPFVDLNIKQHQPRT